MLKLHSLMAARAWQQTRIASLAMTCLLCAGSALAQHAPTLTVAPAERVRADVATHGIEQPVPDHIKHFLKDQGAWYTPFSRPGMTGPYDIRGWHAQPPRPKTEGGAR